MGAGQPPNASVHKLFLIAPRSASEIELRLRKGIYVCLKGRVRRRKYQALRSCLAQGQRRTLSKASLSLTLRLLATNTGSVVMYHHKATLRQLHLSAGSRKTYFIHIVTSLSAHDKARDGRSRSFIFAQ